MRTTDWIVIAAWCATLGAWAAGRVIETDGMGEHRASVRSNVRWQLLATAVHIAVRWLT